MSIDILQDKIRKLKNPVVLELGFSTTAIPEHIISGCSSPADAMGTYCRSLLSGLKGCVPAVRVSFGAFAILGAEGIAQLQLTLKTAADLKYYVFLDAPEIMSSDAAEMTAMQLLGSDSMFPCNGLIISCYLGTDILKPFLPYCKKEKKSVFAVVRTGNKSAPELQDLLTGSRVVHEAAADHVNRCNGGTVGKFGYSQIGVLTAANAGSSLKSLRSKYPGLFLMLLNA